MFKKKTCGAHTPEYIRPIPMPPALVPKKRRIKTIVKEYFGSINIKKIVDTFDNEVNEAIKSGWELDKIGTKSIGSIIMFYALLHRYERDETEVENDPLENLKENTLKMINSERSGQ